MSSPAEQEPIQPGAQGVLALTDYLARGGKPDSDWRVGTECEKLAVSGEDGRRLAYHSEGSRPGILTLLEALVTSHGWRPFEGSGPLVALKRDGASITLEPGGQFELSGAPFATIHEANDEFTRHHKELAELGEAFGVQWLFAGADPTSAVDAVPWMPKPRYAVMRDYLPTRGQLGLHMMKKTCTIQANLDYRDEVDMGRKLRSAMGIASTVQALYANSPFVEGALSPYKTVRGHIWTDTDEDRAGLLPWVFDGEVPSYEQWVLQALRVPMFAVVREGTYHPAEGTTFGAFIERGFQGFKATFDDWIFHLSTLFYEVRIKTHLEVRSADCVPPRFQMSLPALYKGLLYDDGALEACLELTAKWTYAERQEHRRDVTKFALDAAVPRARYRTVDIARELVSIATQSLQRQSSAEVTDESCYLQPLQELLADGRCLADDAISWFKAQDPSRRDVSRHYLDPSLT